MAGAGAGRAIGPAIGLLGLGLFASGGAALVQQVAWQRRLISFLGGADWVSSMVVVLVVMVGLGLGAGLAGRLAAGPGDPLRALAILEAAIAASTWGLAVILAAGPGSGLRDAARAGLAWGLPEWSPTSLVAFLALLGPCLLMGATVPLASEVCQRRMGRSDPSLLSRLAAVSTAGSALGALVGALSIGRFGVSATMQGGALASLGACLCFAVSLASVPSRPGCADDPDPATARPAPGSGSAIPPKAPLATAFLLGVASLGFEILLFRLFALRHRPLPMVFATVLAGVLVAWTLGAELAYRQARSSAPPSLRPGLRRLAAGLLVIGPAWWADPPLDDQGPRFMAMALLTRGWYFLPSFGFGWAFATLLARARHGWGREVGDLAAASTLGSATGVVAMTLLGSRVDPLVASALLGILVLWLAADPGEADPPGAATKGVPSRNRSMALALAAVMVARARPSEALEGHRAWYGPDGVLEVVGERDLYWDGLWHSRLTDGRDHVGTRNWWRAVLALAAYPGEEPGRVAVVGLGLGITASVLAAHPGVGRVDGYEIARTLGEVLAAFPRGTLEVARRPKVRILWQDARAGLELSPERYHLIVSQPLHLAQAGSGNLNSVEFLGLLRSRLVEGGVVLLYAGGTEAQRRILMRTADAVFRYRETCFQGTLLLLSDRPMALDPAILESRLSRSGNGFWERVRAHPPTSTGGRFLEALDRPRREPAAEGCVSTDDLPLVEYPELAALRGCR